MGKDEKFWDRLAAGFADDGKKAGITENRDYQTILKYLGPKDRVLDYGCATGTVANAVAAETGEVDAIDISSRMIEFARAEASERNIRNVNYIHAGIFDDRLREASFDMVLAFRVLHLTQDPPAVMRRINGLLKPGGIFISVTACMGVFKIILSAPVFLAGKLGLLPEHISFFKPSELRELVTEAGLEIVECERMADRIPQYCIVARKTA